MLDTAGQNLTVRLRKYLFESFLKQEMVWFDKPENNVGMLCAILAGESVSVQSVSLSLLLQTKTLNCLIILFLLKASGMILGTILNSAGTLLLCLIVAFYYQWKLALVCFLIPAMCLAVVIWEQLCSKKVQTNMQRSVECSLKVIPIYLVLFYV